MTQTLVVPQGSFELARHPERAREQLRAWDAADEYLLRHVAEDRVDLGGSVVVANDAFGALAVALAAAGPVSWGDSSSSHAGLAANLLRNDVSGPRPLPGTEAPPERIDVLLIKVPKHNSLLEDQLQRLRPLLHEGSVVIGSGMVKAIHTSTLNLFANIIGPTRTSLAKKKARLIFSTFDPTLVPPPNPWPLTWRHAPTPGGEELTVVNHAGVFSARSIDVGTRFLLENLKTTRRSRCAAVDLGCGNGVVGAAFLKQNPNASCLFIDDSYAAVASARQTVAASIPDADATFVVTDDLSATVGIDSMDLIINNPPFHASTALSGATAEQMFTSSRRALRPGGELIVIGNRHLGYHARLKRLFGDCDTLASNRKFVVLRATA